MTPTILELNDEDLQTINDALMQMPYFRAAPLVVKINAQLHAQLPTPPSESHTSQEKSLDDQ